MKMVKEASLRAIHWFFGTLFVLYPTFCVIFLGLTYIKFVVSFENAYGFCWAQNA